MSAEYTVCLYYNVQQPGSRYVYIAIVNQIEEEKEIAARPLQTHSAVTLRRVESHAVPVAIATRSAESAGMQGVAASSRAEQTRTLNLIDMAVPSRQKLSCMRTISPQKQTYACASLFITNKIGESKSLIP